MIYAILLDVYQGQVAADQYAVSYSGSLADCQAQTNHDGDFQAWLKSDFTEQSSVPTQLEGPQGTVDAGRIVGLQEVSASLLAQVARIALPVAAVGAGVAGVIAVVRRRKPRTSSRRKRR